MIAKKYKMDELLQVKEPSAIAAEVVKRIGASEDGTRKLVLRDVSNGSDPTSRRSRFRSSSVVTNPYDDVSGEDLNFARKSQNPSDTVRSSGHFNKYSPTPSIKRGKAAELLKQHGSPPGIRVTAGGRIVPNMASPPILSPRFDQNNPWKNENRNYNRFGRPGGYTQQMPANPFKGLNGYVVDMGNGNLCQIVDGELRPVQPQPDGMLGLYMPAPNLPLQNPVVQFPYQFGPPLGYQPFPPATPGFPLPNTSAPSSENATSPVSNVPTPRQLRVMEQVHAKLEQELKELDRNEVLQRGNIDAHKKSEIVKHRIALTNRIDESRRGILETRRLMADGATGAKAASTTTTGAGPQAGPGPYPVSQTFPNAAMPFFVGSPPLAATFGNGMAYEGMPAGFPQPIPGYTTIPSYENLPAQFQPYRPQDSINTSSALEERHANIDNGSVIGDTRGSTDTSKGYNTSMNLDGSSHQPRRSHAIEIKKPTESSKTGLNPTSPSYQPDGDDNGEHFMPSPTMIAGVDNLVQSPRSDAHGLDGAHHPSDSSATTGDFFPHDTQQYSSRKFAERSSADSAVNLQPWMTKDNSSYRHMSSSASIPTKYVFSDLPEFKHEELNVNVQSSNVHPPTLPPRRVSHGHEPSDLDFISGSSFQPISPATKKHQSAHLRESIGANDHTGALDSLQSPTAQLLNKVTEHTASMHIHAGPNRPQSPPKRSEAYWEGFKTGLQQEVLGVNTDEEYRRGYRDGMRQSMVAESSPGSRSLVQQFPSPPGMYANAMREGNGTRIPSLSREAHSSAPYNSLSTTPQRSDKSPSASQTLDSPQAQADFMSQPNVNISSTGSARRQLKVDTNVVSRTTEPPTSPLANRSGPGAQKTVHFSKIKQVRTGSYDNEHYKKKAKAVVDRSDTPARPQFMPKAGAGENSSGESQPGAICIPLSPRQSPIKTMMELLNVRSSSGTGSPEKKSFSRHFSSKKA